MTTDKYTNTYRHSKLSHDEIRAKLRDLDFPGPDDCRTEVRMKREALQRLQREKK